MNDRPFYILAIDGGGIRGVFAAYILKCLQSRLSVSLLKQFDMVAGTSTGAILAASVACDIDPQVVLDLYEQQGTAIFARRKFWGSRRFEAGFRSRYQSKRLFSILGEIFGDVKLGQILTPLLLPATDIGNGVVHVFKSTYSSDFTRDADVSLRDAIMASCAAPTYFDPVKILPYLLADGGLWANNPALAAAIDAQKRFGVDLGKIKILSIGTGHAKTSYGVNSNLKWGLLNGWKGPGFIDFLMSLQAQATQNYLQLLMAENQIVRLNFESDCPLPLDDCSAINDLISNADRVFSQNSKTLRSFLEIS